MKENAEITKLLARAQIHLQKQKIEYEMPLIKEWITQSYNMGVVDGITSALESKSSLYRNTKFWKK